MQRLIPFPTAPIVPPAPRFRRADPTAALPPVKPAECFFFSSRRRHTRFSRDWSSDVCSSDLFVPVTAASKLDRLIEQLNGQRGLTLVFRSEERRVGKECRSWLPWYQ